MAVVFISAELEEVLRLSHRIAVLRDRRKVAEITNDDDVTMDDVVHLIASGGSRGMSTSPATVCSGRVVALLALLLAERAQVAHVPRHRGAATATCSADRSTSSAARACCSWSRSA